MGERESEREGRKGKWERGKVRERDGRESERERDGRESEREGRKGK